MLQINYNLADPMKNWVGDSCSDSLNGNMGQAHGFVCVSYNANETEFPECDESNSMKTGISIFAMTISLLLFI
jgi:hypothetical protein